MRKLVNLLILGALGLVGQRGLYAAPILQLYVEGGAFDKTTNTWVLVPPGSSSGAPFRLWVVGNVDGPGGGGVIEDVRLAVAYGEKDLGLVISLRPSQAGGRGVGGFHGFTDPSLPEAATLETTVRTSLGAVTTGPGIVWQEFSLGDFTLTDSPVGDFAGWFPTELHPGAGQINVYEVSVVGGSGARLHFDVSGTTGGQKKTTATGSHEPDVEVLLAPEPATIFVWCLLGLTWAGSAWMYRYRSRWQEWEEEETLAPATVPTGGPARPIRQEPIALLWPARARSRPLELPSRDESV